MTAGTIDVINRSRTKIVATIGPACEEKPQLADLVRAGVDVFRINMAHSGIEDAERKFQTVREVGREFDMPVGVLVDLAGPKIRLGQLPGDEIHCNAGETFTLERDEVCDAGKLSATYDRLIDELAPGDTLMLADGTVSMQVEEVSADEAQLRVVQPGTLRSRQGINLPGVKLSVPTLGEDDVRHAQWAAQAPADFIGLSFVRSPDDVRQLKQLIEKQDSPAQAIAKIEKREALEQLEEIVRESDGIMVARGDLGVEIDVAEMPIKQKQIIGVARQYQRPVIIATQMLDSMQHARRPTRAEATDVANAVIDGCDACMLSGETAVGQYPREAVAMMNRITFATERGLRVRDSVGPRKDSARGLHRISSSVVEGAGLIARQLEAKLIVVASHSGATALGFASQRNLIPTVGVSDQETTLRRMCLYFGVVPLGGMDARDVQTLMRQIDQWGLQSGCLSTGDQVVIVAGSRLTAGVHDMLVVHEVESRGFAPRTGRAEE